MEKTAVLFEGESLEIRPKSGFILLGIILTKRKKAEERRHDPIGPVILQFQTDDPVCHLIFVDEQKNISIMKPRSFGDSGERIFSISIPLKIGMNGFFHTEFPLNRLIAIRIRKDGYVWIIEKALISQNGKFFLTEYRYFVRCCNEQDRVKCPKFSESWPQMENLLQRYIDPLNLEPIEVYQPEKEISADGLRDGQGKVLWWSFALGMGAIRTSRGDARVHYSQIRGRSFPAYLKKGEKVSYRDLKTPRNTKGRKTMFIFEAVDVRPL